MVDVANGDPLVAPSRTRMIASKNVRNPAKSPLKGSGAEHRSIRKSENVFTFL